MSFDLSGFRKKRKLIIQCLSSRFSRWSPGVLWLGKLEKQPINKYGHGVLLVPTSFSLFYQEEDMSELTSLLRHSVIALAEASAPLDGPIIIYQELR